MADVFISYARKSRPAVRRLAEALEAEGWSVWWDTELLGGTEVEHSIRTEIAAARCVVVVWTHHSITRPFVLDEARLAQEDGKLVPTRFEDCAVPLGFGNLHAVDLWDWKGDPEDEPFRALAQAIERLAPRDSDGRGAAADRASARRKRVGSRPAVTYETRLGVGAESVELPFCIGVLGDFGGHVDEGSESVPFREWRFLDITRDNFDEVLIHVSPRLVFQVENRLKDNGPPLKVVLNFHEMDDFRPSALAMQISSLRKLFDHREDLEGLRSVLGMDDLRGALRRLVASGGPLTFRAIGYLSRGVPFPSEEWDRRGLDGDDAYEYEDWDWRAHETALEAAQATFSATIDSLGSPADWSSDRECDQLGWMLAARIQRIDELISDQLDPVLHHPDFQALESRWRGLHRLVEKAGDGALVRIRILPATMDDALYSFERAPSREDSALFQRIYSDEVGTEGGLPFGMIVADYDLDHHPKHVKLLWFLGDVASVAGVPIVTGAAPTLFNLDSLADLGAPGLLTQPFGTERYARWRRFREEEGEASGYVFMTVPRILLRRTYEGEEGRKDETRRPPDLRETCHGPKDLLWGNSAYALAECAARSFLESGVFSKLSGVSGGGLLEGLSTVPLQELVASDPLGPTEAVISDALAAELESVGLVPLLQVRGTDRAVFRGPMCMGAGPSSEDDDAAASARLQRKLSTLLVAGRFRHTIGVMVRDLDGQFGSAADLERYLNDWIAQWVDASPTVTVARWSEFPLREARVDVVASPRQPGSYQTAVFLRSHF